MTEINVTITKITMEFPNNTTKDWKTLLNLEALVFYQYLGLVQMTSTILVLMCLEKRKILYPNFLGGHFALIVPVNLLESKRKRKPILAVFSMITIEICEIIYTNQEGLANESRYVKFFGKVLLMTVTSLHFLPILYCINVSSLRNCIIGLIYMCILISLRILDNIPDPSVPLDVLIDQLLLQIIVFVIATPYLFFWFIKQAVRRQFHYNYDTMMSRAQTKYIKSLLSPKHKFISRSALVPTVNGRISIIKNWFHKHIYHNIPGFKYSLSILVSCTVGFIAVSKVVTTFIYETVLLFIAVSEFLREQEALKTQFIPNIIKAIVKYFAHSDTAQTIDDADEISMFDFIRSQLLVFLVAIVLGIVTAYVVMGITICHMLMSYRKNVLNVYRRQQQQEIIDIKSISNVNLTMAAMHYAGYQVAYFLWGYVIHVIVFCIIYFMIGELLLLPLKFAFWMFFGWMVELILPFLVVILLTKGVLHILIKYAFLEDRGKTMALNNRKGFCIAMYTVFFYNVFTGIFSCVLRIIKGTIIGTIMVSRLDKSVFPRLFESQDSGFRSYSCLLHLEALQTNPIVNCFVDLLLHKEPYKEHIERINFTCISVENPKVQRICKFPKARNRWFVAFTLIQNPSIIGTRGVQLVLGIKSTNMDGQRVSSC